MKLIYCPACNDIIALRFREVRTCLCSAVGGYYADSVCVVISAEAIPLDFENLSFGKALRTRPIRAEKGVTFSAFTLPEEFATVVRLDRNGNPVLIDVHGDADSGAPLRNLLFGSIALTYSLYRRTKDFQRSIARTPEHLGNY